MNCRFRRSRWFRSPGNIIITCPSCPVLVMMLLPQQQQQRAAAAAAAAGPDEHEQIQVAEKMDMKHNTSVDLATAAPAVKFKPATVDRGESLFGVVHHFAYGKKRHQPCSSPGIKCRRKSRKFGCRYIPCCGGQLPRQRVPQRAEVRPQQEHAGQLPSPPPPFRTALHRQALGHTC
jgi:hypothetical protein